MRELILSAADAWTAAGILGQNKFGDRAAVAFMDALAAATDSQLVDRGDAITLLFAAARYASGESDRAAFVKATDSVL